MYQEKERSFREDIDDLLGDEILGDEVFAPVISCKMEQRVRSGKHAVHQTGRVAIVFGDRYSLSRRGHGRIEKDAFSGALGRNDD